MAGRSPGKQDPVDHVDDAVGRSDVGGRDARAVDVDVRAAHTEADLLAVQRLRASALYDVGRGQLLADDVVEQDRAQLLAILQERVELALRDLGERRVGRGEHGEGTGLPERAHEAGPLEQLGERGEVAGGPGRVDDVGALPGRGRG